MKYKKRDREREIEREIDSEKEEGKLYWMLSMSKKMQRVNYSNKD